MSFAQRVASRFFNEWYNRIARDMSRDEAYKTLGLRPGATEEEIKKTYRTLALQSHPDKGGDAQAFIRYTAAKDVLLGKTAPKMERGPSDYGGYTPPPRAEYVKPPRWDEDPETKVVNGETFAQANSNVPQGVEWKFVSMASYYYKKTFYPGEYLYIAYGQKDGKHIFAGYKHRAEGSGTIPTDEYGPKTHFMDDWQAKSVTVPMTGDPLKVIPKHLKALCDVWGEAKFDFPKKWTALAGHPTAEILRKVGYRGIALKDVLVGTGVIQEGAAGNRKTQVEIITTYNLEKQRAARLTKKTISMVDQFDFTVRINGKSEKLADDTVQLLAKRFIPWGLTWDRIADGQVTNITKLRGGGYKVGPAETIRYLVDALTSEPSWVHIALEKAYEEWEPESKTAGLHDLVNETSLHQAAAHLGLSPWAVYSLLMGAA